MQGASGMTFPELHYAIQVAMGWTNSHLHQFILGRRGTYIGIPHPDYAMDMEDSRELKISEHLRAPKDKLEYEYDFGDSWEHEVVVKKVLKPEPGQSYPVCTDGHGACPPEDCGGVWGYADLLEILKKPGTDEYKEMTEWLGADFDPNDFDVAETNEAYFKNFKKEMQEWDDLMDWEA